MASHGFGFLSQKSGHADSRIFSKWFISVYFWDLEGYDNTPISLNTKYNVLIENKTFLSKSFFSINSSKLSDQLGPTRTSNPEFCTGKSILVLKGFLSMIKKSMRPGRVQYKVCFTHNPRPQRFSLNIFFSFWVISQISIENFLFWDRICHRISMDLGFYGMWTWIKKDPMK